jgi:hypothetical protein
LIYLCKDIFNLRFSLDIIVIIGSLWVTGIGLSKEKLYHTDKGWKRGSAQLGLGYSRRLGEEEKCQCKTRPDFVRAEAKRQALRSKMKKVKMGKYICFYII